MGSLASNFFRHVQPETALRIGLACTIIDWAGPTPYDDMRLGFASQTAGARCSCLKRVWQMLDQSPELPMRCRLRRWLPVTLRSVCQRLDYWAGLWHFAAVFRGCSGTGR